MADSASERPSSVTVFWRPGCGFCSSLLRGLDGTGLALTTVNIWEDDAAASTVRSITGGSETVPSVLIGSVAMVNPSATEVLRAVAVHAPHLIPGNAG